MMNGLGESQNKRKYDRYKTDVQIQFYVNFDVKTKLNFRVKKQDHKSFSHKKHQGISKNVNVEGLCFISTQKLNKGNLLLMDVFVPSADKAISMEGEVLWNRKSDKFYDNKTSYETGVRLNKVKGELVEKSIIFDNIHNIAWSNVLESVFSDFKHLILKRKKSKNND